MKRRKYSHLLLMGGFSMYSLTNFTRTAKAKINNFHIMNKQDGSVLINTYLSQIDSIKLVIDKFDINTSQIRNTDEDLKLNFNFSTGDENYETVKKQNIKLESSSEEINVKKIFDNITIEDSDISGSLPQPDEDGKQINIQIVLSHIDFNNDIEYTKNFILELNKKAQSSSLFKHIDKPRDNADESDTDSEVRDDSIYLFVRSQGNSGGGEIGYASNNEIDFEDIDKLFVEWEHSSTSSERQDNSTLVVAENTDDISRNPENYQKKIQNTNTNFNKRIDEIDVADLDKPYNIGFTAEISSSYSQEMELQVYSIWGENSEGNETMRLDI